MNATFEEAPEIGGHLTIERDGFTLCASIQNDAEWRNPWSDEEGHGPVSDWRARNYAGNRNKRPGEIELCNDGPKRGSRFYDFAAACAQALADGWDAEPFNVDGRETPRQQAAKAARADFERLRSEERRV